MDSYTNLPSIYSFLKPSSKVLCSTIEKKITTIPVLTGSRKRKSPAKKLIFTHEIQVNNVLHGFQLSLIMLKLI